MNDPRSIQEWEDAARESLYGSKMQREERSVRKRWRRQDALALVFFLAFVAGGFIGLVVVLGWKP